MTRALLSLAIQSTVFTACKPGGKLRGLEKPALHDAFRFPKPPNSRPVLRSGADLLEGLQDFWVLRLEAPIHGDRLSWVFTQENQGLADVVSIINSNRDSFHHLLFCLWADALRRFDKQNRHIHHPFCSEWTYGRHIPCST